MRPLPTAKDTAGRSRAFQFEKLKSILVCPKSRADLVLDESALVSTCSDVRLRYTILEGIPRLLVDEAEQLSVEAWSAVMTRHGRDSGTGQLNSAQRAG